MEFAVSVTVLSHLSAFPLSSGRSAGMWTCLMMCCLQTRLKIKFKRVAFAESATFTMMTERFVTLSILAALLRTNLSENGTMLRIKFDLSFQGFSHFGLFLEERARWKSRLNVGTKLSTTYVNTSTDAGNGRKRSYKSARLAVWQHHWISKRLHEDFCVINRQTVGTSTLPIMSVCAWNSRYFGGGVLKITI